MKERFISVFSGFIFTQGSAVSRGTGHALQCTESCVWDYNRQRPTGTAKWDGILKLYKIDKQNVLYHLLPNVMHRHVNPG
jgi:hypothetical protein